MFRYKTVYFLLLQDLMNIVLLQWATFCSFLLVYFILQVLFTCTEIHVESGNLKVNNVEGKSEHHPALPCEINFSCKQMFL